jgi:hypothetical protein
MLYGVRQKNQNPLCDDNCRDHGYLHMYNSKKKKKLSDKSIQEYNK